MTAHETTIELAEYRQKGFLDHYKGLIESDEPEILMFGGNPFLLVEAFAFEAKNKAIQGVLLTSLNSRPLVGIDEILEPYGARLSETGPYFEFPSGATLWFFVTIPSDAMPVPPNGAWDFVGFNGLTHFKPEAYKFMADGQGGRGKPTKIRSVLSFGGGNLGDYQDIMVGKVIFPSTNRFLTNVLNPNGEQPQ